MKRAEPIAQRQHQMSMNKTKRGTEGEEHEFRAKSWRLELPTPLFFGLYNYSTRTRLILP